MTALVLQRFDRFNTRTEDLSVPDLEPKLAVIQRLLLDRTYALLKHPHLFNAVQVIEDDPLVTLDHNDFARFVGIGPANVHVSQNVFGIAQRDETNIVAAVSKDLSSDRADPLWGAIKKVIEDRDVVGCEVPESIDVAADGAQVRPARVQIIDPAGAVLDVLFYLADASIEHKGVPHHQYRGVGVRQFDQLVGLGRRRG